MIIIVYVIILFFILPITVIGIVFSIVKKTFGVKKAKMFSLIASLSLIITGSYTYEKLKFISSHKSPNNKYELIIKRENLISSFIPAIPGQGGVGDKSVIVILKHKGKEINRSKESLLYQNIDIYWNLKENKVGYAKPNYFELLEKQK